METNYIRSIAVSEDEWIKMREIIRQDYAHKPSMVLLSSTLRKELGFTMRSEKKWVEDGDYGSGYQTKIWLDFYNEEQKTYFILKYLNREQHAS